MSLCEVRIPTYKRPDLLKRALATLREQTYDNWQALVFDDSPEQEAKAVVEFYSDDRIIYKPHKVNLGRSKNINCAFLPTAYVGGEYAFVLEDDNYLLPDFIAENIKSLENNKVNIVLRNQEVRLEKDGTSVPTNMTTRGKWFKQGVYSPDKLYARLFFCEGISNGGLFWKTTGIKSNFQVDSQIEHSWHQELFRTLQIQEPIYFESTPLCIFTEFERDYNRLKLAPKHNRATQSILMYLVQKYGDEIVQEARKIATESQAEAMLEQRLLNVFYFKYNFRQIGKLEIIKNLTKDYLRYLLFKDPFKTFLSQI
ncbi:MAG: glycosyltransferase [Tolypothrix carrinoi HA7290-LM1]|jgi:glycosyltransferase involved in cell wall biosynthesis|nr:glycosyltransferase [Tolypothrix carrinoi HA7290-LM1]